ncbi:MAG: tetrahydromethanopterin S-methyltransferase subunit D [Candidatus Methanomethylicia archaeon]
MDFLILIIILIAIAIAGILISIGTMLLPIGGAPAAMFTSTGIATGAEMMLTGSGITGILMSAVLFRENGLIVMVNAGLSSAIMMSTVMLICNFLAVYGRGVPPALYTREKDPITGENVKIYITPGTTGHGIPTACFISGIIGAFLGGLGGALTFIPVFRLLVIKALGLTPSIEAIFSQLIEVSSSNVLSSIVIAATIALGMFLINANITAYAIRGVIEGWWDPKFKNTPRTALACFLASIVFGCITLLFIL